MRRIVDNVQLGIETVLFGMLFYSTLYVLFDMVSPGSAESILSFAVPVTAWWLVIGIAVSYASGALFLSLNAYYERRISRDDPEGGAFRRRSSYRSIYTFFIVGFIGILLWLDSHLFDAVWILGALLLLVSYVMIWNLVFGDSHEPSL